MEVSIILSPLKAIITFILLLVVQIIVCNNILLFNIATPFIYIFFIISLPMNVGLNVLMLVSFLSGFLVDLFSDTMGVNCMACLILSVLRKPIFYAYVSKEDKFIAATPSVLSMGWWNYLKYILTLSAIFCLLVFSIELFNFLSVGRIMLMAAGSTLFTVVLLLACDALLNHERL